MENTFNSSKETRANAAFNEVKESDFKINRTKAVIATSLGCTLSILQMKANPNYSKASVLISTAVGVSTVLETARTYGLEESEKENTARLGGVILGSYLGNRILGAITNKFFGPKKEEK